MIKIIMEPSNSHANEIKIYGHEIPNQKIKIKKCSQFNTSYYSKIS